MSIFELEQLRSPLPKPSRKRQRNEAHAKAVVSLMKSIMPKQIIATPSQMHPEIRIFFALCIFNKRANIGEKIAIEIEYEANTIPWREVGTPFFRASCGKKGAIEEYAELANKLTRQRQASTVILLDNSLISPCFDPFFDLVKSFELFEVFSCCLSTKSEFKLSYLSSLSPR